MWLVYKIKSYLLHNTSTKQTIIKNTFWLFVAEWVSKGSLFLISILVARQLGPEQFGVMSFVMSFVTLFILLTDFWLTTLMVREVIRDQNKLWEYFINGNFLKIILGIITLWIVRWVSHYIGKPDFYINLILIYCGYSIINNIGEFVRAFFRPSEKMQHEAVLKIINGLLVLIIIGGSLWIWCKLEWIFYAYLIAGTLSLVMSLLYILGKSVKFRFTIDKSLIKQSLVSWSLLLFSTVFIQFYVSSDQVLLWLFWFEKQLWVYSAMYKIINILMIGVTIYATSFIPTFLKNISIKKITFNIKLFSFLRAILMILFIFFGRFIISILYGSAYNSWYNVLIILVVTSFFMIQNNLLWNILIGLKKEKKAMYAVLLWWIFNIVANIVLIPKYGMMGTAFTTLWAEILVLIILWLVMMDFFKKLKTKD